MTQHVAPEQVGDERGSGRRPCSRSSRIILLGALSALLGILARSAAAQCPPPSDSANAIWTLGPLAGATASAPISDAEFRTDGGSVSYLTSGTTVYAIRNVAMDDSPSGTVRWSRDFAPATLQNFPNPVPLQDGTLAIFVARDGGFVHGLDANTGVDLPGWSSGFDARRATCPADQVIATPSVQLRAFSNGTFREAFGEDVVFVITRARCADGDQKNRLIAIGASSKTVQWVFDPSLQHALPMSSASEGGTIDYDNNIIFFGTAQPGGQDSLWAIRTAPDGVGTAGSRVWSKNVGPIHNRPQLRSSRVYVVTLPGTLRTYQATTGSELYSVPVTGGASVIRNIWAELRPPYESSIFSVDSDGFLHRVVESALGPDAPCDPVLATGLCGVSAWSATNVGGVVTSQPVVAPAAGKVYVGLGNGIIHQVNASDGTDEARGTAGTGPVFDPTLDVEGGGVDVNRLTAAAGIGGGHSRVRRFCIPWVPGDIGSFVRAAEPELALQPRSDFRPTLLGQPCNRDAECAPWEHRPCAIGVCLRPSGVCASVPANPGGSCDDGEDRTCSAPTASGGCPRGCTNCDVCVDGVCAGVFHPADTCTTLADTLTPDRACPYGFACCQQASGVGCVDILKDPSNCGGCGYVCAENEQCGRGSCMCGHGVCIAEQSTPTRTSPPAATATTTPPVAPPTRTQTRPPDLRRRISITDVSFQEGNAGDRAFKFLVTLSAPSTEVVTVQWSTRDGTARAGTDYRSGSGTLTFLPGRTDLVLVVAVIGDTLNEPNETFTVGLFNATNALIADNQGLATILNDDIGVASLAPRDGSVAPGAPIVLTLGWTHPERWRLLDTLDLRLRDADEVIGWVRFSETPNTFSAVDPPTGEPGPGFAPRSDVELTSAASTIRLRDSDWVETADHQRVDVTWQFAFDASAAGRVYAVEAAATDDDGFSQPFAIVGTLAIGNVCGGDCSGDGAVSINELVTAVGIALDDLSFERCLAADADRDERVRISDLIAAVGHALDGCPATAGPGLMASEVPARTAASPSHRPTG